MMRDSCVVKTQPAMPTSLSRRISSVCSPCSTREYSSPVAGSLRNKVPRSESVSRTVISMSAPSTSSSVSMAETVLDTCRRVSAKWRRLACSVTLVVSDMSAAISRLHLGAQRRSGPLQLLPLLAEPAVEHVALPSRFRLHRYEGAAQLVDGRLQLRHLVRRLHRRRLHRRVSLQDRRFKFDPQGVDHVAGL